MDEGGSSRGSALRLSAIGAAVVLGMFGSYQLGMAGGSLLLLLVPLALAVFVVGTLAALQPDAGRRSLVEAVGWERFDLELERSRRHERPMALLRISRDPRSREATGTPHAAEIREAVRILDVVWSDGAHVFVLMPETDQAALSRAIGRILARLPSIGLDGMRVALYPEDGLTSGALIARLEAPDAEPRAAEMVHLAPAPVDVAQQDRTG
jgi:hypothetical protein